jgi:hypothetical protein
MKVESDMLEIRPLIQRSPRQIEAKFGVNDWARYIESNPEIRYVEIDNGPEMYELISDRKFSGKHLQMLFLIENNQDIVIGYESPSAYNAWMDFLLAAEEYINYGKSIRSYGIEPLIMAVQSIGSGNLNFSIYNELDISNMYVNVTLPAKEFMSSLTIALKHFLGVMNYEYKVEVGDEGIIDRVERLMERVSR